MSYWSCRISACKTTITLAPSSRASCAGSYPYCRCSPSLGGTRLTIQSRRFVRIVRGPRSQHKRKDQIKTHSTRFGSFNGAIPGDNGVKSLGHSRKLAQGRFKVTVVALRRKTEGVQLPSYRRRAWPVWRSRRWSKCSVRFPSSAISPPSPPLPSPLTLNRP